MVINASVTSNCEKINQWNALNDVVIKTCIAHPISLTVQMDGEDYTTFRGDGLICATPSGSTAYSYSAGGPIIDLALSALAITPICPHMSNFRSIVVNSEAELAFRLDTEYEAGLYIDGKKKLSLKKDDYISINNSGKEACFVKLTPDNNAKRVIYKRKEITNKLA
jgi:NAD+ kinase